MSNDAEAAKIAIRYAKTIKFAAVKASRKWKDYMDAKGASAAFTAEDIDQLALEAMLVLAGVMTGVQHVDAGRLQELEGRGGERWVQNSLDLYVSARLHNAYASASAEKRGGGGMTFSLNVVSDNQDGDENSGAALLGSQSPMEANPEALTGIVARFPILYATEVEGRSRPEIMARYGIGATTYTKRRKLEADEFTAWAYRNRRVAA